MAQSISRSGSALRTRGTIWPRSLWNYLAQIVTMMFGAQFAELLPPVQDLIEAIGAGNFQGILSAVFALGTIVFYLVRDNVRTKWVQQATA